MRVKLFTHNDLDGVSCALLANLAFGSEEVDVQYCGYHNIDDAIKTFIINGDYNNYEKIYITDISTNKEVAELIDKLQEPDLFLEDIMVSDYFTLLDHHKSAEHLNSYLWCNVETRGIDGLNSGTSLFYKELIGEGFIKETPAINQFVELVRRYDTWEWADIYNDEGANDLNSLLTIYSRTKFLNKITILLKENEENFELDDVDNLLLELHNNNKRLYFKNKSKELKGMIIDDYYVGVVFAEQHLSELGNFLAKEYKQMDFIILITSKTISYRGIKENIDLSKFAEKFGGGGHIKASGSRINEDQQNDYILRLFNQSIPERE